MKLKYQTRTIPWVLLTLVVFGLVLSPGLVGGEENTVDFPTFDLIISGDVDVDTFFVMNYHSVSISDLKVGDIIELNQDFGDVAFYQAEYLQSGKMRLSFRMILEAPLIDIWDDDSSSQGIKLNGPEEDLQVVTEDQAQSERDMGLSFLFGSESKLLDNDTADSWSGTYEFGTDFDLDTYNILYLEDFRSYATTNTSIVVSYVETTSYDNLNGTNAYNKTIYNEFVADNSEQWWRLDLENTNSSFDEYVANIAITSFYSDGARLVSSVSANVTDTRYETNYIGDLDTAVSLSEVNDIAELFQEQIDPITVSGRLTTTSGNVPEGLTLSGFWSNAKSSNILSIGSKLKAKATNVKNEARGWNTANSLEDAIKSKIVNRNPNVDSISDLSNLEISKSIGSWGVTKATSDLIKDTMDKAAEVKSNIEDVVEEAKDETIKRIHFATDLAAEKIEDVKAAANEAKDNTLGAFAAAKAKVSNWGANVKNSIADAAGKIKDGAISIASKAKGFVSSAANRLILLIVGGLVALVVVLIVLQKTGVLGSVAGFGPM